MYQSIKTSDRFFLPKKLTNYHYKRTNVLVIPKIISNLGTIFYLQTIEKHFFILEIPVILYFIN